MHRLTQQLALSFAAFNGLAEAFWRMPCERSGSAMLDPMVSPGKISDHNHVIHGGTNFGLSTVASDLLQSTSTSCEVTQDKSAYWTPSLHFMYPNGTTVMVEQVGGMLAYYLLYNNPGSENITAFPEGFRMLAGDPYRRNFTCAVPEPPKSDWTGYEVTQPALAQKALGFNCLDYSKAPEPSLGRHFLPDKQFLDANCVDGVRFEIMFPSCWVGGNQPDDLDPPDHQSHMAYPDLVMTGTCPEGFPVKTPSIFFETIWNTYEFYGIDGQFVLATGDPTGYSYHGDFMPAWEDDILQQAVDTCTNPSGEISDCPLFNIQDQATASQNLINLPPQVANDVPQGPCQGLPGKVPIFAGPEQAPAFPGNVSFAALYPAVQPESLATVAPIQDSLPAVMGAFPINVVSNGVVASNTYTLMPTDVSIPAGASYTSTASASRSGNSFSSQATNTISEQAAITSALSMVNPTATATTTTSSSCTSGPVSTQYVTKGDIVYQIMIDEEIVTEIVAPTNVPTPDVARRHMHHHHHQLRHGRRIYP